MAANSIGCGATTRSRGLRTRTSNIAPIGCAMPGIGCGPPTPTATSKCPAAEGSPMDLTPVARGGITPIVQVLLFPMEWEMKRPFALSGPLIQPDLLTVLSIAIHKVQGES